MSEVPNIPVIRNDSIQNSNPNIPYINIGANNVRYIQTFGVANQSIRQVDQIGETTVWINGVPTVIPPTVPVTVLVGKPIVNMPGCVAVHKENAKQIFGRTAHYEPETQTIVIFITNRHPKDILRSFCHEMIHHVQNERGDLNMGDASSPTYAQDDKHMRNMEKEAYLEGNLLLRDYEDNKKYN